MEEIINIPINDIQPNPYQPESRLKVAPEVAKKFADSIQEHGLIQMPVVRKVNGHYEMGDGWLRLAGFRYLFESMPYPENEKWSRILVQVRELDDRQMADMVMEANTIRQDLNPIELAKLYKKYLEDLMNFEMFIAECPFCGSRRYSWSEEDALEKLSKHRCWFTLSHDELWEVLDNFMRELAAQRQEVVVK